MSKLKQITETLAITTLAAAETLAANRTLTVADGNFLKLIPSAAHRDVTLPAEKGNDGLFFFISNFAASALNLVVKDDGGSTIATLNQNEAAFFVNTGSAWIHLGIITVAQS